MRRKDIKRFVTMISARFVESVRQRSGIDTGDRYHEDGSEFGEFGVCWDGRRIDRLLHGCARAVDSMKAARDAGADAQDYRAG
ncbi:MAG: hypothetical protein U1F68_03785 [Gammaproteobacteria bacterium]